MDKFLLVLCALVFVASYCLTWLVKIYSLKNQILDVPNERSSHTVVTPRGGGLAILIVWYTGITVLFFNGELNKNLYFALLSGILLAAISLADDILNLKPVIRLFIQIITAGTAFYLIGSIKPVIINDINILPEVILFPATIIGMVWFINLYNFLDGIDGYASVEAVALALAIFIFTGQSIALILIAAVLGFLIWNWPKARIFMGDVGSTQLGFIIVVLAIYFHNEQKLSIFYWLVLASPFWFDASLTLFRRWRNKEKLSQAHRKHIYQRLVQSGFSHLKVDALLTTLNLILMVLVFFSIKYQMSPIPLLCVTLASLYMVTLYADKRKPF